KYRSPINDGQYGADIPDVCLLVLWIAPLAPLAWWLWTHEKLLRSRERISQYVRLHFWKSLATVIIMTLCIWGLGYTGWRTLKQRHQMPSPCNHHSQRRYRKA